MIQISKKNTKNAELYDNRGRRFHFENIFRKVYKVN